jgi:hypothetical protein
MHQDSLSFIEPLTWDEVFALWRAGEAVLPRWIEHYKSGGFASWDEWRRNTLRDVQYATLSWKLFRLENPTDTALHFFGGPFRAWIKNYYQGRRARTFEELANDPKIQNNEIVKEMVADFPAVTHLVGLQADNQVFIIEGMHRCCALAIMALQKMELRSKVLIALAPYSGEIPEMGRLGSPT